MRLPISLVIERGELVAALVHELGGPADDGGALLDRAAAPLLEGGVGPSRSMPSISPVSGNGNSFSVSPV